MMDEILEQKIKFAREIRLMLKVTVWAYSLITSAGISFAIYRGKPSAAIMGGLAGSAATVFMWFNLRHIRSWLAQHEHDEPSVPLEEVRAKLRNETLERERERIQKRQACSDKSHWRSE